MRKVYHILCSGKLGKDGFIVLCTHKIYDDFIGLEEAVDIYPYQCHWSERMDEIRIRKGSKTKSWYISYVRIKGQNTKIAVVYTTKNSP